jgi:tetratricopeptide (TPR) repeat protein
VVRLGKRARWVFDSGAVIARREEPLASRVEIETCARCHARRSVLSEDYEHGRPLMDTHLPALLDDRLYHADGQILEEVYVYGSFLQSRMFAAGVTCSDCHDSHSLSLRSQGNSLCATCHRPDHFDAPAHHFHAPDSTGASCVACHMPARTYMVVDERHDHGFRVPRPDLSVSLGTPNACSDCHRDRPVEWALEAVTAWYGAERKPHFGEALDAGRRNQPHAARVLAELADDPAQPAIARATALRLLRTRLTPASLPTLERALDDDDPLVRGAALEALEPLDPALRLRLAQASLRDPVLGVRVQAASVLAPVPRSLLDAAARRDLARALAEYRATLQTTGDRPEGHLRMGALHASRGEVAQAESAYRTALRLAPDFVPTYINLADVYRVQGREDEGERLLRRALALEPQNADVHHALGLLLVRRGLRPEALEALGRAAELDPERARYAYVYGVALQSAGRGDEAVAVLERAHERHPGDRELLLALVTISRDLGAGAAALAYARELVELAPEDPASRGLLAELERQADAR